MPDGVKFQAEKRLSAKIAAHKVKAYFPSWVDDGLLKLRYAFFQEHCTGTQSSISAYSDGSWVNRKTTSDLVSIQNFLSNMDDLRLILQIGIGNSSLYCQIGHKVERLVGVTIVNDEKVHAATIAPNNSNYDVILANKFSMNLENDQGRYQFIVDNDISSYACCKFHFTQLMSKYYELLSPGGAVLIGKNGLGYFDTGFGLTRKMLTQLALPHGFEFTENADCIMLQKPPQVTLNQASEPH